MNKKIIAGVHPSLPGTASSLLHLDMSLPTKLFNIRTIPYFDQHFMIAGKLIGYARQRQALQVGNMTLDTQLTFTEIQIPNADRLQNLVQNGREIFGLYTDGKTTSLQLIYPVPTLTSKPDKAVPPPETTGTVASPVAPPATSSAGAATGKKSNKRGNNTPSTPPIPPTVLVETQAPPTLEAPEPPPSTAVALRISSPCKAAKFLGPGAAVFIGDDRYGSTHIDRARLFKNIRDIFPVSNSKFWILSENTAFLREIDMKSGSIQETASVYHPHFGTLLQLVPFGQNSFITVEEETSLTSGRYYQLYLVAPSEKGWNRIPIQSHQHGVSTIKLLPHANGTLVLSLADTVKFSNIDSKGTSASTGKIDSQTTTVARRAAAQLSAKVANAGAQIVDIVGSLWAPTAPEVGSEPSSQAEAAQNGQAYDGKFHVSFFDVNAEDGSMTLIESFQGQHAVVTIQFQPLADSVGHTA